MTPPTHPATAQPADPTRSLRLALRANAAFSSTCALVFLLDGAALAPVTGVPQALLALLGVGLLGFGAALVTSSMRSDSSRLEQEAKLYCAADVAWVVGSVPIIALGLLTTTGGLGLAAVGAVVSLLAGLQWRGLGRLARAMA